MVFIVPPCLQLHVLHYSHRQCCEVQICMHARTHTHARVHTHTHTHTHTPTHPHTPTHTHIHVHTHAHAHSHTPFYCSCHCLQTGANPIHGAAMNGHAGAVRVLTRSGCNIDQQRKVRGETAVRGHDTFTHVDYSIDLSRIIAMLCDGTKQILSSVNQTRL